mmetsp:Transcript_33498/g.75180  ORF Transcript_33498/g.75180 Transcript_33498/m.75180 type:complete len:149 (+) Transcript_33498:99-545(+)
MASKQLHRRPVALVCPRKKSSENEDPIILTREILEKYFHCSLSQVSAELGICPTAIKRACRKLGISKWPYKTPNPGPKRKRTDSQGKAWSTNCWTSSEPFALNLHAFPSLPLETDPFEEEREGCFANLVTALSTYYEMQDLEDETRSF